VNIIVCGGNIDIDSYYFIRCIDNKIGEKVNQEFHLITPTIKWKDVKESENFSKGPILINEKQTIEQFLNSYKIKIAAPKK
jgi:hypothetical protein